jgi:hypothetical protein
VWTRRSDDEIQSVNEEKEAKRKSLTRPLYWAIPISIVCTLLYALGYRGGITRGVIIYSDPIALFSTKIFTLNIFCFSVLYVAMFVSQRRGSTFFSGDDLLLCGNCQEASHANLAMACPCGGRLEPFEYYRWDED